MATNFNTEPYYDDYDEDKGFYKILFKPGVSVQARELTQIQSIIQKQIERHGSHVFKEGSKVTGGEFGYTDKFYAVKIQSGSGNFLVTDYIDQFVGLTIQGQTSGVTARVVTYTKATAEDPHTLFVKYVTTGDDKETTQFLDEEQLICVDSVVNGIATGSPIAQVIAVNGTAIGASASIERGVYFVRGNFVLVDSQRIILDKYDNVPTLRVGLEVIEDIVTADDDQSLLDTAQNAPNYSARGADRYTITLKLSTREVDEDVDDNNFIELERINEGRIVGKVKTSEYSDLEKNLARRTYDESGDYVVKPFQLKLKETLNDGTNNGVYFEGTQTDDGNEPSSDLMTLQVSTGKAYVQGFEVSLNQPAFIDIEKPREFIEVDQSSTTMELGNYVRVDNVFGSPEVSSPSVDLEAFNEIALYDTVTTTLGQAAGNKIGVARARAFELENANQSGAIDVFDSTATYRLYLFDIKMFTELTTFASVSAVNHKSMIRGVDSRAYGYMNTSSDGTRVVLTSVVGKFRPNEDLVSSHDNYGSVIGAVASVNTFGFENVKQCYSEGSTQGVIGENYDFTADLQLESAYLLSGSANVSGSTVTGLNAFFSDELVVGDAIDIPSGSGGSSEIRYVTNISNNTLTLDSAVTNSVNSVNVFRRRSKINDQEKHILLRYLDKEFTRSTSNVDVTRMYRQFVATSNSSGQVILNAGAGQSFVGLDNDTFTVTIVGGGTGTGLVGEVVNVESDDVTTVNSGSQITITSSSIFGANCKVKIIATINKVSQIQKSKLFRPVEMVEVLNRDSLSDVAYGTSSIHRDISLGVADVTKVVAIYESRGPEISATLPTLNVSTIDGTFAKGEVIRGLQSGATGRIIDVASPIRYVQQNAIAFQAGEEIVGIDSGTSAEVVTVTPGSKLITNNFLLDTGQRDNYYDIAKLTRKSNVATPYGQLLVVFDFFEHSSGDFFTVESYSSIPYNDIPSYTATRIDPETRNTTGIYDLRSTIDFRPRVANIASIDSSISGAKVITGDSFDFESRIYSGLGSSRADIPADNSSINYDYSYYIGRRDTLYITTTGELRVVKGISSEYPKAPESIENAMKLADLNLPPYVLDVEDVGVLKTSNKRYTMKDIGLLEKRLNSVEYYTSLSLLEKSAETLQIKDANGLDRFKSGFLVDNFGGHKTGDVLNRDYRCGIDMVNRVLRPKYKMKNISLEEVRATPESRLANNYVSFDNIVTLPYDEVVSIEQNYATRVENLNPVLNFSWAGTLKLEPSADEWFEIERLPDVVNNVEGNFDTIVAQNKNAIGTVWDAPVTAWTGILENTRNVGAVTKVATWNPDDIGKSPRPNVWGGRGMRRLVQRQVADEVGVQSRTGIETTIIEQIDVTSDGDRLVAESLIPYIRQRDVLFEARGLKPLTRVYPFFDKVNVSPYVTPTSGSIISKVGEVSTKPISVDWDRIKVIQVSYDNNSNKEIDIVMSRTNDIKKPSTWNSGVEEVTSFTMHNHSISGTKYNKHNDDNINRINSRFPDAIDSVRLSGDWVEVTLNNQYRFSKDTLNKGWYWIDSTSVRFITTQVSTKNTGFMQYKDSNGNWVSISSTNTHPIIKLGVNNSWAEDPEAGQLSSSFHARSVSRTTNRSVAEFNFVDSPLKPNQFGEGLYRFRFYDRNGDGALRGLQISEITFFDENYNENQTYEWNIENALISNVDHTEVIASYNMKDATNLINGGKVYDSDLGTWVIDGINYRSDHEIFSEAIVAAYTKGECGVDLRLVGGTRTAVRPDNNLERFAAPGTQAGDALVTDASGYVSGIFEIPDPNVSGNPVFETGERLFRLSSDPSNGDVSVETFAQNTYTAKGVLKQMQESFTATRNGVVATQVVSQESTVTRERDLGQVQVGWYDPLAQSIMPSTPGGEFITSVEVYFSQKDDNIPVRCELREMVTGLPTTKVIPFASKTLQPEEVNISQDGSVGTTFTFDAPIYVKDNVEIAIVLISDSDKYLAWISRMGEKNVADNKTVSEQPYLGVLFKSQNNSTWTAYDYEDLKFKLYRASFDISKNGLVELENVDVPMDKLGVDPLKLTQGSSEIIVAHDDHGMYDNSESTGNYVVIDGITSGISGTLTDIVEVSSSSFTIESAVQNGFPTSGEHTFIIRTNVPIEASDLVLKGNVSVSGNVYTVTPTTSITSSHPAGAVIELYELDNLDLSELNNVAHKVTKSTIDSYVIEIDGFTSTVTDAFGGNTVVASSNAMINDYQLMIPVINHADTEVRTKINFLNSTSVSGSEVSYGEYGEYTTELVDRVHVKRPGMIASPINELNNNSGRKSMKVTLEMSSAVENLSPIVDLERKSITTYVNRVDNVKSAADTGALEYIPATDPEGDSGEAIYITKRVQLQNPATSLKVYIDALRNPSADIQVMYKVLRSDDSTDFDELGWNYFNSNGESDVEVPAVSDRSSFREYEYTQDNIPEFISFSVKIKMNGTNSSEPVLIKDLRAIALAV
jgi:hypothetical protein